MAGISLPFALSFAGFVLTYLKPSFSYCGRRFYICVLGTAWFEIGMAATKLPAPTHICWAYSEQSADPCQLRQQAHCPK